MDTKDLLVKVFVHYYKQHFDQSFVFNRAPNEKLIDNFFKRLSKKGYHYNSIGEDFLNRWFRFQFEYWADKETARKPTLSWFIGTKAIKRYFETDDTETKEYWVNRNSIEFSSFIEDDDISEYEESLKKRFHNTEQGLSFCLENTSLYSKSINCITCKFKIDCQKLLKENYPLLYKRRLKNYES